MHKHLKPEFDEKINCLKSGTEYSDIVRKKNIQVAYKKFQRRLENISRSDERFVITKYNLSFQNLSFPLALEDVELFMENNEHININIFGLSIDDNKTIVGPLFSGGVTRTHTVHLLYLTDSSNEGHYIAIKNLSRLVSNQLNSQRKTTHFCDVCLTSFCDENKLNKHKTNECWNAVTEMPLPGTKIKFENFHNTLKAPLIVYADFECILKPIERCETDPEQSGANPKHLHIPSSYAYLIKSTFNEDLDLFKVYRGENCAEEFVKNLFKDVTELYETHVFNLYKPVQMTKADWKTYNDSNFCSICNKPFETAGELRKCIDHCHMTGKFRSALHMSCNIKYHLRHKVSVIFHNFR